MPIAGFVRLRKHQFGRQDDFGTKVSASRAYPFKGTPTVELNWTDPDIDVGSRDVVAPPYRSAPDITAALTDPALAYDQIPLLMCGFFGGDEHPVPVGSLGFTWTHEPASVTVDDPDLFTYEFGDDVTTDWFQLGDGMLENLEISGPDGLGPLSTSMSWRFGSAASTGSSDSDVTGTVPTPGLNVETTAAIVYLKDGAIFIGDSVGNLSQVSDALHNFTLKLAQEIDVKRFANGSQVFDAQAYGPGKREITLECTWAKTSDIVGKTSEADDWFSDEPVNRFVGLTFTSTKIADGSTPYSWTITMPMRYYTRAEGEIGGNTTVILTGHAFYDATHVFTSVAVTTLAEGELEGSGS